MMLKESQKRMCPKLLGEGTSRIVYDLHDGTVIKLAQWWSAGSVVRDGYNANLEEADLFEQLRTLSRAELVVPIGEVVDKSIDGNWLIMKKYNNEIDDAEAEAYFRWLLDVIPVLDCCRGNIARDENGNFVLIDYERLNWTWLVKSENPYYKDVS